MHPVLKQAFARSVELFRSDPRVQACWLLGSAQSGHEDAYSDVDPMLLVDDAHFEAFSAELPHLFRRVARDIVLWWPERGNTDMCRNFAILFTGPPLLQYDINILRESAFSPGWLIGRSPEQLVFDKTGMVTAAFDHVPRPVYRPDGLLYQIELFWVYAFIIVKYLRRNQLFKLCYTQQVFRDCHLEVLRALYADHHRDWWPISLSRLATVQQQEAVHRYFAASDPVQIAEALPAELDSFAADAQMACEMHEIPYPYRLETAIRTHIAQSGYLDSGS